MSISYAPRPMSDSPINCRRLYAGLTPAVERAVHRAASCLELPCAKNHSHQDGTPSFEFTGPRTTDIDQTIDRLLELPQHVAIRRKRRWCWCSNEFQEIVSLAPDCRLDCAPRSSSSQKCARLSGQPQTLVAQCVHGRQFPLYKAPKCFRRSDRAQAFSAIAALRAATAVEITMMHRAPAGHHQWASARHQKLGYFTWAAAEGEGTPPLRHCRGALALPLQPTRRATQSCGWTNDQSATATRGSRSAAPTDEALSEDFRRRTGWAPTRRSNGPGLLVERGLVEREGRARSQCRRIFSPMAAA